MVITRLVRLFALIQRVRKSGKKIKWNEETKLFSDNLSFLNGDGMAVGGQCGMLLGSP